eukprot:5472907-Prymnesium_polylepis.2
MKPKSPVAAQRGQPPWAARPARVSVRRASPGCAQLPARARHASRALQNCQEAARFRTVRKPWACQARSERERRHTAAGRAFRGAHAGRTQGARRAHTGHTQGTRLTIFFRTRWRWSRVGEV